MAYMLLGSQGLFEQSFVAALNAPTNAPTNAPAVTFERIGTGYCADSMQRYYSYAIGQGVGSTAEDCSAWCLQNPDNLIGFSYFQGSLPKNCYCEFDGGDLPDPLPTYTNPSSNSLKSNSGSGPIQGTSLDEGGRHYGCYVYQNLTLTPTNLSTAAPTISNVTKSSTNPPSGSLNNPTVSPVAFPTGAPSPGSSLRSQSPSVTPNDGPTFKFYPNWLHVGGSRKICLFDDGSNEVPVGTPKYDSSQECCAIHYNWNLDECNNADDAESGPSNKYFPNWNGAPYVCLLDDGTHIVPESAPLYADLTSCCDLHYSWNMAQCNAVDGPTGKYYPNLDGDRFVCLHDSGIDFETLPLGARLYDDRLSCCEAQYPWASDECINHLV
eukprot:scaffold27816_cov72-Cyclotella_meneghiniana.AAC.2